MRIGIGSLGLWNPLTPTMTMVPTRMTARNLAWFNLEAPNRVASCGDNGNWA